VAHTYSPSTQEAEAGGIPSARPAWVSEQDPVLIRKIVNNNGFVALFV
jgi:hypothetical protein